MWLLWMSATAMLPEMVSQTDRGVWNCSSPAPFDPMVLTCISVTPSRGSGSWRRGRVLLITYLSAEKLNTHTNHHCT